MLTPGVGRLVTCWAVVGRNDPVLRDRTLRVLRYCQSLGFEDCFLLSAAPMPSVDFPALFHIPVLQIPELQRPGWEIFMNRTVPEFLRRFEDYTMAVHEDGFPIEPALWDGNFLNCDYIAAPWWDDVVGSGGCALTTGNFWNEALRLPYFDGGTNADEWLCRAQRAALERAGVKFAETELAYRYCTETTRNERPSFAFHGRVHCPEKYKAGWEKIERWEKEQGL